MAPWAIDVDRGGRPSLWTLPNWGVNQEGREACGDPRAVSRESPLVPTKRRRGDFIIGVAVPYLETISLNGQHWSGQECVRPRAFRRFLKSYAPVVARVDPTGKPIASTNEGSLRLWEVPHGLACENPRPAPAGPLKAGRAYSGLSVSPALAPRLHIDKIANPINL